MKISFTMKIRVPLLFVFICFVITSLPAQNLAEVLFGKNNKANYIGQYNYNGKRKNGFGIERFKNGTIYIGDFSEDKITGRGMLISMGKDLPNVDRAKVYIGHWNDGKKDGKGICYDANGNPIYEGRFSKDKPVNKINEKSEKHFKIVEIGQDLYFGEMISDTPEGFGLVIQTNGCVIYGTMKGGIRQGVGMIFYNQDVWEVGQWKDGEYRAFNNSQIAKDELENFRYSSKEWRKEMRDNLWGAVKNFANAGITTLTIVNDINGNNIDENLGDSSEKASDPTVGSNNGKGKISGSKCTSCQGSGKCSPPRGYGNRKNACHGSKLCGWCDGTGWNSAGGSRAVCTACGGSKKCKTCNGTGKCQQCGGTGK